MALLAGTAVVALCLLAAAGEASAAGPGVEAGARLANAGTVLDFFIPPQSLAAALNSFA